MRRVVGVSVAVLVGAAIGCLVCAVAVDGVYRLARWPDCAERPEGRRRGR